jgi:hypothetical protein
MSDLTPRLGLAKPADDDDDWGDDYRSAMDTLDDHPGVLVATSSMHRPVIPFNGQVISRPDLGALEQYREASSDWGLLAGGGGGTVAERDGLALHGEVGSLAPGASSVVVSFAAPINYHLTGLLATGLGDGYFVLSVEGQPVLAGRTHVMAQNLALTLPTSMPVDAGQTVQVAVTNTAEATTSYEATITGEH